MHIYIYNIQIYIYSQLTTVIFMEYSEHTLDGICCDPTVFLHWNDGVRIQQIAL